MNTHRIPGMMDVNGNQSSYRAGQGLTLKQQVEIEVAESSMTDDAKDQALPYLLDLVTGNLQMQVPPTLNTLLSDGDAKNKFSFTYVSNESADRIQMQPSFKFPRHISQSFLGGPGGPGESFLGTERHSFEKQAPQTLPQHRDPRTRNDPQKSSSKPSKYTFPKSTPHTSKILQQTVSGNLRPFTTSDDEIMSNAPIRGVIAKPIKKEYDVPGQEAEKEMAPTEHKCRECGRTCESALSLSNHVRGVHRREFDCIICTPHAKYSRQSTLEAHLYDVHKNSHPFICEKCKKAFANKQRLDEHESSKRHKGA